MSKLVDNAKKLKDNVNLAAKVTTTGEIWAIKKPSPDVVEINNPDTDDSITLRLVDLPDIEALIRQAIEYIENLP